MTELVNKYGQIIFSGRIKYCPQIASHFNSMNNYNFDISSYCQVKSARNPYNQIYRYHVISVVLKKKQFFANPDDYFAKPKDFVN